MSDQNPPSRRPKEIPEDIWYDMEESQKMEAIKRFNPTLYQQLLEEENAEMQEETYVSRRPKEVSPEQWDMMEEDEKMAVIKKYNPAMYEKLMAEEGGEEEEETYVSRRPKEVSPEQWDNMEEDEKMAVIKKYNPGLYETLMTEMMEPVVAKPPSIPSNPYAAPHTIKPTETKQALPINPYKQAAQSQAPSQVIQVVRPPSMTTMKTTKKIVLQEEEEEEENSSQVSRFKLVHLISQFEKFKISVESIFVKRKRIKFLLCNAQNMLLMVGIPSKYEMFVERPLGIGTYELVEDEQEDDQDTLFFNRLPIENLRREKLSKMKSLSRFLPLVNNSPIKVAYVGQYFLVDITQENEVEHYILSNPIQTNGYYLFADLGFVIKYLPKLNDELCKFETAFNDAVYDRLEGEVENTKQNLLKVSKRVNALKPSDEKKSFGKKVDKLMKYVKIDKHTEKANKMLLDIRHKNLQNMFMMENVTYVLKEFK